MGGRGEDAGGSATEMLNGRHGRGESDGEEYEVQNKSIVRLNRRTDRDVGAERAHTGRNA